MRESNYNDKYIEVAEALFVLSQHADYIIRPRRESMSWKRPRPNSDDEIIRKTTNDQFINANSVRLTMGIQSC